MTPTEQLAAVVARFANHRCDNGDCWLDVTNGNCLEELIAPLLAELQRAQGRDVWVWEQKIGDEWYPYEDKMNCGSLNVHPTAKYVEQPKPHTPQFGRFRWSKYSRLLP